MCKKETSTIKKKGIQKKPEASNFIKKETLAQVFSCKFCEISKSTFFTEQASKPFKLVTLSSAMALANLKETFLL